jgi:hypothetical protein
MFAKKKESQKPANTKKQEVAGGEAYSPTHQKPKIILLDLPVSTVGELQQQGLNAVAGTLGTPYKVQRGSGYVRLECSGRYPNYTEQEIVVVDLEVPEPVNDPPQSDPLPETEPQWWAHAGSGIVDPRPKAMEWLQEHSKRIYESGGAFIAFATPRQLVKFHFGRVRYRELELKDCRDFDPWGLLPETWAVNTSFDVGTEVTPISVRSELRRLLTDWLGRIEFSCTMSVPRREEDSWEVIATNKYGAPIGLLSVNVKNRGMVLLLPQMADKDKFIARLFKDVLPHLAPHLFPDFEGAKWVHRQEYENPAVLKLEQQKRALLEEMQQKVATLEAAISSAAAQEKWLQDLLTENDDSLVAAVRQSLVALGFTGVVDVDPERDAKGQLRREDLQIRDRSPLLVVDIKGVGGYPADEECQQAHKHATLCMKSLNRTDVQSLTVINHQRNIPPLERENRMPFRQEILDYADEIEMGLLTTWDLWRLVRSFHRHGWLPDQVKPIFYRKGRIEPIPEHYEYAGDIVKVWPERETFGVVLQAKEMKVGEKISFELPTEFIEHQVSSLQVDGKSASQAAMTNNTGIQLEGGLPKLKEGTRVFRVIGAPISDSAQSEV